MGWTAVADGNTQSGGWFLLFLQRCSPLLLKPCCLCPLCSYFEAFLSKTSAKTDRQTTKTDKLESEFWVLNFGLSLLCMYGLQQSHGICNLRFKQGCIHQSLLLEKLSKVYFIQNGLAALYKLNKYLFSKHTENQ